jgi:hypothetical protein
MSDENQVPVDRADNVPLARSIDEPLLVEDLLLLYPAVLRCDRR